MPDVHSSSHADFLTISLKVDKTVKPVDDTQLGGLLLLVEVVPRPLLWRAALSVVLSAHSPERPCPAVLHLHKALVAVGLAVVAANRIVLARADAAATAELERKVPHARGQGSHVDVAAKIERI
jgi:hypothetical protein